MTPKQLPEALPPAIEGFDALINGEVAAFVNMSEGLGGLIAEQVWNSPISRERKNEAVDAEIPVCLCTTGIRCRTKVLDHHHKSEEARYSVSDLHGNIERAPGNDRGGQ